jgi:DNA mismatch repair ATPase MutS
VIFLRQEIDYGQYRYEKLSLLWKDVDDKCYFELSPNDLDDLNLQSFKESLLIKEKIDLYQWILKVPSDMEVSLYRQAVMKDFVDNNNLFDTLMTYGKEAHKLMSMGKFAFERESTVYNVIKRMDEVVNVREMTEKILSSLQGANLTSKGLTQYKELLEEIVASPIYDAFMKDVEAVKSLEEGVKSIKIGLNLDEYLQPIEAILLELSQEEFKYSRNLKKMGYYINYGIKEIKMIPRKIFAKETVLPPEALNTLEKTIEPATLQLIKFCDQFNMKILEVLSVLYHELPYYQIGLELYYSVKNRNEVLVLAEWKKPYILENIYHPILAVDGDETIVKNTIIMSDQQKTMILTGANRGGKTTMTQTIGIALWFGQLGFFLPGRKISLPYVSHIFLHFPREEQESIKLGRLGEECQRFQKQYVVGDSLSFYLMNESFLGTSHNESIQLAIETIKAIHYKGAFLLFNTHLHELLEELEKEINPDRIKSFIAGKDMEKSPFLIEEGRPLGKSYAFAIAKQYGMLYEQLIEDSKE